MRVSGSLREVREREREKVEIYNRLGLKSTIGRPVRSTETTRELCKYRAVDRSGRPNYPESSAGLHRSTGTMVGRPVTEKK